MRHGNAEVLTRYAQAALQVCKSGSFAEWGEEAKQFNIPFKRMASGSHPTIRSSSIISSKILKAEWRKTIVRMMIFERICPCDHDEGET